MPKVPVEKLKPGMKLSGTLIAKCGALLLNDSTDLTEKWNAAPE